MNAIKKITREIRNVLEVSNEEKARLIEVSKDIIKMSLADREKDFLKTTNKFLEELGELAEVVNSFTIPTARYKEKKKEDFMEELADTYLLTLSLMTQSLRHNYGYNDNEIRDILHSLLVINDVYVEVEKIPQNFLLGFNEDENLPLYFSLILSFKGAVDVLPKKLNKWKSLVEEAGK